MSFGSDWFLLQRVLPDLKQPATFFMSFLRIHWQDRISSFLETTLFCFLFFAAIIFYISEQISWSRVGVSVFRKFISWQLVFIIGVEIDGIQNREAQVSRMLGQDGQSFWFEQRGRWKQAAQICLVKLNVFMTSSCCLALIGVDFKFLNHFAIYYEGRWAI